MEWVRQPMFITESPVDELTLAQCAMIAALPKAPSRINPITSPERAQERRDYVLRRMRELDYIDETDYRTALAERDHAFYHGATTEISAPYLAEMVRREVVARLGEAAYTGWLLGPYNHSVQYAGCSK